MPRNSFHRNSVIRLRYLYMAFDWIPCLYYKVLLYLCALRFTLDIQSFLSFSRSLPTSPWPSLSLSLTIPFISVVECWRIQNTLNIVYIIRNFVSATWFMAVIDFFLFLPFSESFSGCYLTTKNSTSYAIKTGKCSRHHGYSIFCTIVLSDLEG